MKGLFFFIGTEAELIKLFPVVVECRNRGLHVYIIASGQNDIKKSRILDVYHLEVDLELSREEEIRKNAVGLLRWFCNTGRKACKQIRGKFQKQELKNSIMIVHGDTVSTVMGAWVGKKLGMLVCHVEAGLRSHHLLNPFPEEIDRILTSKCADVHFAPGEDKCRNLKKTKGDVIDTKYNTIIDSLECSKKIPFENKEVDVEGSYFVFVLHRQENLANKKLVQSIVEEVIQLTERMSCKFILHLPTKIALEELGLLERCLKVEGMQLLPRMDYFDFMKLLDHAAFVITDGGSNQEELFYMGKPCLVMRKTTERNEGLGENAKMYGGDISEIADFANQYKKYEGNTLGKSVSPSCMIADYLLKRIWQ